MNQKHTDTDAATMLVLLALLIPAGLVRAWAIWLAWGWHGPSGFPLGFWQVVGILSLISLVKGQTSTTEDPPASRMLTLLLASVFGALLMLATAWIAHLAGSAP